MRYFWLSLSAIILLVGGIAAGAQPATPPAAVNFAVVDMDKVMTGYQAFQEANAEFRRYASQIDRQVDMNRRLRLLDDQEVQELKDLRAAAVLSPEQRIRLQSLEAFSDAREQELAALEQKSAGALTVEERARKEALNAISAKRALPVANEEKRLSEDLQKKNREMAGPFDAAIKKALEKLAQQNKVAAIFNKDAVLWTPLDLTEGVLNELNKTTAKKP